MTLDVFNEGMFVATSQPSSGTVASYNFDVPTNPVMTTLSTSFTSGDVLFSALGTTLKDAGNKEKQYHDKVIFYNIWNGFDDFFFNTF